MMCKERGCDKASKAQGYCNKHYQRHYASGNLTRQRSANGEAMEWLRALIAAPPSDKCIFWPYVRSKEGYSRIYHQKRMYPAHRLVCELAHGTPENDNLQTAHSCGKGRLGCVNPAHLRWATKAENEADKRQHGTVASGVRNAQAKLTDADIGVIRELAPFMTQAAMARHYKISPSQICRIVAGKRWNTA